MKKSITKTTLATVTMLLFLSVGFATAYDKLWDVSYSGELLGVQSRSYSHSEATEPDVACDFGNFGVFSYDGTDWSAVGDWDSDQVEAWGSATGSLNNMAIDYGTKGLWNYDGTDWTMLGSWDPVSLEAYNNKVAVDFGAQGLFEFDGTNWYKLGSWDPEQLAVWGSDQLAVDYGSYGLYSYDTTNGWTKLGAWNSVDIEGWYPTGQNNQLIVSYGKLGVWKLESGMSDFVLVHDSGTPKWILTEMEAWGDKLILNYGASRGMYSHEGTGSVTTLLDDTRNPTSMMSWGTRLICTYLSDNPERYNGTDFADIDTEYNDKILGASANYVYKIRNQGASQGLYKWDGTTSSAVSTGWFPDEMEGFGN